MPTMSLILGIDITLYKASMLFSLK
uniref:Uncharacterized protein n=1 Tax=Anguilla anguilla TaxID=7936 RepID=A0A0E9QTS1_ANGAN